MVEVGEEIVGEGPEVGMEVVEEGGIKRRRKGAVRESALCLKHPRDYWESVQAAKC